MRIIPRLLMLRSRSSSRTLSWSRSYRRLVRLTRRTKDAVLVYVDSVSRSIAKLNDAGVLHLKSPEAQADFKLAVTSLQSAIVVARALIAGISKPVAVK